MIKNIKIGVSAVASPVVDSESRKCILKSFKLLSKNFLTATFIKGKTLRLNQGWNAGSIKQRLDDFMKIQKKADVFIAAKGGYGCLDLIDKINYEEIKKATKFVGFSDVTALLLAIYSKTGIVTYHGPDFKKISTIDEESINKLHSILMDNSLTIEIPQNSNKSIDALKSDIEGVLIGGNLSVFSALVGTSFLKFNKNKKYILFFEDTNQSPPQVDFLLKQIIIRSPKIMSNNISAIILGNFKNYFVHEYKNTHKSEMEVFKKYFKIPIIKTGLFGHSQSKFITFPIGAKTKITKDFKKIIFSKK